MAISTCARAPVPDTESCIWRGIRASFTLECPPSLADEFAGVAQLVEQRTCNATVEGSTPFSGTIMGVLSIFGSTPGILR